MHTSQATAVPDCYEQVTANPGSHLTAHTTDCHGHPTGESADLSSSTACDIDGASPHQSPARMTQRGNSNGVRGLRGVTTPPSMHMASPLRRFMTRSREKSRGYRTPTDTSLGDQLLVSDHCIPLSVIVCATHTHTHTHTHTRTVGSIRALHMYAAAAQSFGYLPKYSELIVCLVSGTAVKNLSEVSI